MSDILSEDVKVVNYPFPERIHLQFDDDHLPEIYWESGDNTKEYICTDAIATRVANLIVGLKGLVEKADPLHPPELVPAAEVGDAMAAVIRTLGGRVEAIRAAAEEPLSDLAYQDDDPSDALAIIRVRAADLRALRDALEGAKGVGDV